MSESQILKQIGNAFPSTIATVLFKSIKGQMLLHDRLIPLQDRLKQTEESMDRLMIDDHQMRK